MRTVRFTLACWAAIWICAALAAAQADDVADAKAALEKQGVQVLATGVRLASESDLSKELNKLERTQPLQKTLRSAATDLKKAEENATKGQNVLNAMKAKQIELNAGLAKVAPGDVATNNRIVGLLQALDGQLDLGRQEKAKLDEAVKTAHGKYSQAREAYLEQMAACRKLADALEANYAKKANDPEIKANLVKLNAASGKQFTLTPTAILTSGLKKLKGFEDAVVSEAIELRSDDQHLWVNVFINGGSAPQEMIVSSGSGLVILTAPVAAKLGVKPGDNDPMIRLVLADGRELPARQMRLKSVRVGKFEVEDVDCAVLGEEAVAAQPTLGRAFLESFKYEIDSAAKTLTMVKVGDSGK